MHAAVWIVALAAVVTAASALSRRVPLPPPLSLTVLGLAASFVPGVPPVRLTPDIVLVIVTTLVTALMIWWLLPVPFAVAVAVGAVVAPPDAVAATAVARRVGMPRRMVTVLEGAALLNDATSLVGLRTAIAATSTTLSVWGVGLSFLLTAAGGLAVGLAVAVVTGRVRRVITDEITDTAVSLVTPFLAYLVAEELHVSGVLAVVVAGLILSHKAYLLQSASSRIFERTNWRTIEFLLENAVFFSIGLQARQIVADASESRLPVGRVILVCVAVPLTVMALRPLWVFPMVYPPVLVSRIRRSSPTVDPLPWSVPAGISWAGMRGVVTVAAAFVLPTDTPYLSVLVLIAIVVVGSTLLLQGATLPLLLTRLGLRGPDVAAEALQLATLQEKVSAAGLERLDEIGGAGVSPDVLERLRRRSQERRDAAWERLGGVDETPSQAHARLRTQMIDAERTKLLRIRDEGLVASEVLAEALGAIDVEETVLQLGEMLNLAERDEDLVPRQTLRTCSHLGAAATTVRPGTPGGCKECLEEGLEWVHLRICLSCGHVG